MRDYNPNAWFQWRELRTCAVQIILLVGAILLCGGIFLYLTLRR